MAEIRSATQAPELHEMFVFSNIWSVHPDAVDLSNTNVYFLQNIMTWGK